MLICLLNFIVILVKSSQCIVISICILQYLKSVRPLLDDEKYARMEKLSEEFRNGLGKKFQRYLQLKSWWATNYVSFFFLLTVICFFYNQVLLLKAQSFRVEIL